MNGYPCYDAKNKTKRKTPIGINNVTIHIMRKKAESGMGLGLVSYRQFFYRQFRTFISHILRNWLNDRRTD